MVRVMNRRFFATRAALLATALSLASALPLQAAELPTGPVRIVVGFSAGGGTDILARLVANKLNAMWNIPVLVDNKPGAAGRIAAAEVARAAPDGNTLMMAHINSLGLAPALHPKLNYSAERDFTPIVLIGQTPQILIANPSQQAKSLGAFVEELKKQPAKLFVASAGAGSAQHLALALFERDAAVEATHVPYKGSAPLITDLLAGHVGFAFEGMTTASPYVKGGQLLALGQTGAKRSKNFPDVPTIAEQGFPGFEASIWFGVVGPASLPPEMTKRMNADINTVLAMPDIVKKLEEFGAENAGGTPEAYAAFMQAEREKWGKLIIERKISAE